MPAVPGQPHTPTLHPRTRPEANEWALKMRQTNDWFRHDGHNVEERKQLPRKLHTEKAYEIADKARGAADEWFAHNPNRPAVKPQRTRCRSATPREDETGKWFKFSDNENYHTPRAKHRLTESLGFEVKEKSKGQSDQWYRHEHLDTPETFVKHRSPTKECRKNLDKMRASADWYIHNPSITEVPDQKLSARLADREAKTYLDRNKQGSVSEWFSHDHADNGSDAQSAPVPSPRPNVNSDSKEWFSHENFPKSEPKSKRVPCEIDKLLNQNRESDEMYAEYVSRVKPEAREWAQRSVKGLMERLLVHDPTASPAEPNAPRAVKPEARKTFEENKGQMAKVLDGHPAPPLKKSNVGRSVKPEAAETAGKHSGGDMKKVLEDQPASPGKFVGAARAIPAEAKDWAERNKGTVGQVLTGSNDLELAGKPAPKLGSNSGREIAMKHRGTAGPVIFSQPVPAK
ncbi:DgyrCDS8976 [Dimorphilus gyrociliatus]|uniref:DgyrCDS8976 n=1 Tax=Dimorphilus gyrociliatus TaxID=2664684 RepID=A0A7I8VVR0_9ANNE|nr:DgyrCDS8976 [Dimorphilus gyrociliatus]